MGWTKAEARESKGQTMKSIASSGQTGLRLRKCISHKEQFLDFSSVCDLTIQLLTASELLGDGPQLCSGALRIRSRKESRRKFWKGILKKALYPLGIR